MAQKTAAQLIIENNNSITSKTAIESISPNDVGGVVNQDFIDSFWNKKDSPLTLPPGDILKTDVALAMIDPANDKRWYKITNRSDTFPLYIQIINAKVSPFGIWCPSAKPCMVIMDYAAGYEGETNPFLQVIDGNQDYKFTGRDFTIAGRNLALTGGGTFSIGGTTPISKILTATATLNFGVVNNQAATDLTINLAGAAVGDIVEIGYGPSYLPTYGIQISAFVLAPDVVTVRWANNQAAPITLGSASYKVRIIK